MPMDPGPWVWRHYYNGTCPEYRLVKKKHIYSPAFIQFWAFEKEFMSSNRLEVSNPFVRAFPVLAAKLMFIIMTRQLLPIFRHKYFICYCTWRKYSYLVPLPNSLYINEILRWLLKTGMHFFVRIPNIYA